MGSTGSQVIASQINVLNSKLTDFLQVEGGDLFTIDTSFKFDQIDNYISPTQGIPDPTRSALISIMNCKKATIDQLLVSTSSLLKSPVLLIDNVPAVTLSNSAF
jgi:hypothetical protein